MPGSAPVKHVFIVTYGRSGSTLLQGFLNSSPHIHVSGENGGFLYHFYEAYLAIKKAKQMAGVNGSQTARDPFYGIARFEEDAIQPLVLTFVDSQILKSCPAEKTPSILGFKEVRYPKIQGNLLGYLDFICDSFGQSVFLVLFRNLDDVLESGMFKELDQEEKAQRRLAFGEFEEAMRNYQESRSNVEILHYEDFRDNLEHVQKQLKRQGLPVSLEAMRQVICVPHSYTHQLHKSSPEIT